MHIHRLILAAIAIAAVGCTGDCHVPDTAAVEEEFSHDTLLREGALKRLVEEHGLGGYEEIGCEQACGSVAHEIVALESCSFEVLPDDVETIEGDVRAHLQCSGTERVPLLCM